MLSILAALFLFQAQPSLQGTVVAAGGGPLAKALVEVRSADGNSTTADVAGTNTEGKFVFPRLLPGRYKLSVTRSGYVPLEYKTLITLADGVPAPPVRFELVPTGSIYGRVVDQNGQPLTNATVRAMKASYADGEASLKTEQTAITNDLGEYRLFWLPPGSYFVSAFPYSAKHNFGEMLTTGADPKNDPGVGIGSRAVPGMQDFSVAMMGAIVNLSMGSSRTEPVYIPTYFPGTTDQDRATAIKVRPGDNIGRVDLAVSPVETHHIRGIIVNGVTGQPDPRAQLRSARSSAVRLCATPRMITESCSFAVVDYDKATFDVAQAANGRYVLYAMDNDLVAEVAVDVQDSDVDDVVIPLRPGLSLSGKFTPAIANVEVRLSPPPPVPGRTPLDSSSPDGTFTIRGLTPGDYSVSASRPKGYYIKSLTSGDVDVLNRGVHIAATPTPPLEIVLDSGGGTIDGRVSNATGEDAGMVTVALIPEESRRNRSDLYRTAQTDPAGRYELRDIAPGTYKLFAWTDVEPDAWRNAEFMRAFEDRGKVVVVLDAQTVHVEAVRVLSNE